MFREWWFIVMVQKNHHFFLFFDTFFVIQSSATQQILEAPQQNAEAPQQILEPLKFCKEPVFQKNAADFCQNKCQKFGVMVWKTITTNHHSSTLCVSEHWKQKWWIVVYFHFLNEMKFHICIMTTKKVMILYNAIFPIPYTLEIISGIPILKSGNNVTKILEYKEKLFFLWYFTHLFVSL